MLAGRLRKGFLGYNRRQVEEYIAILSDGYARQLDGLRDVERAIVSKIQSLSARVSSVQEELSAYRVRIEIVEAAAASARLAAQYMEEMARIKAEQLLAAAQAEVQAQKAYLGTLNTQIAKSRQQFEKLVESIRGAFNSSEPGDTAAAGVLMPDIVVGRILSGGKAEDTFVTRGTDGLLRVNISAQNLKLVAQSGTAVGQVSKLVLDRESGEVIGYEVTASAIPEVVPDGAVVPASYVLAVRSDRLIVNASLLKGLPWRKREEELQPDTGEVRLPPAGSATPDLPESTEPAPELGQEPWQTRLGPNIEKSQMRHLLDKIAGRDLVGRNNELIVARGQPITREVVERARNEGKLAELIVHMLMPGMNPDEIAGDDTVERNIS